MSHKKKSGKSVAVTSRPVPTGTANAVANGDVRLAAAVPGPAGTDAPVSAARPAQRFWLEKIVVGASHWLGSLQVAVVLLALFAFVLAIGTMVESWYSDKVAKELVYRAWWFNVLLFLLGINIFFAAAKKANFRAQRQIGSELDGRGFAPTVGYWWPWIIVATLFFGFCLPDRLTFVPKLIVVLVFAAVVSLGFLAIQRRWPVEAWWPWKKHQTGFLITHVGLLTLVTGGLMTGLGGTDTTMALLGSPEPDTQSRVGLPQSSNFVVDRETASIRVRDLRAARGEARSFSFQPGSLPWHRDQHLEPNVPPLLTILDFLEYPLPRSWQADLNGGAWLEVLNYYPHAHTEKFRPAGPKDEHTFPAAKVSLTSSLPMMKRTSPEHWVAGDPHDAVVSLGGIGMIRMLGSCPGELVDEFLKEPPATAVKKGQLVLNLAGAMLRLSVDDALGKPAAKLGEGGWKVQIMGFRPNGRKESDDPSPSDPKVEFEIIAPDGKVAQFMVRAQLPGNLLRLDDAGDRGNLRELSGLNAWFDGPDPRFGSEARSVLQLAGGPDGKVYYRSFSSHKGAFAFDKSGEAVKDNEYAIWAPQAEWKLKPLIYLAEAAPGPWFIPDDLRPGLEDAQMKIRPAVRCALHVGNDSKEFWVGRTEESFTHVSAGGRDFEVGFNDRRCDLGFDIKLLRAETLVDPGTKQNAGYTSWVELTDPTEHIAAQDRIITMNQPLEYQGYKFFQSGLESAGYEENTLKPISYSVFTVSRDPGLPLKYLGSTMLALGITCMFYMKAYFFKPRGKRAAAAFAREGV